MISANSSFIHRDSMARQIFDQLREGSRVADDRQQDKEKLISEIYEVALRPELYGDFIDLWEQQLADAVNRLEEIDRVRSGDLLVQDPEIERHFQRAYQILERMGRGENHGNNATEFIGSKPGAALLVHANGDIAAANQESEVLFGRVRNLRQLRNYLTRDAGETLQQFLLRIDRPQVNPEIQVLQAQLNRPGTNQPMEKWLVARPIRLSSTTEPLLYISLLSVEWTSGLERLLQSSFALTKSELEIVRDLSAGNSLNDIAALRDRSTHTIRAQIKSVFPKMGANSQSDIVRMVSTLAAYATDAPGISSVSRQKLVSGTRLNIPLKDGREIPVNVFGSPDARPVLFLHGMLDSFIFNKALANKFDERGIRLIAPSRPGFGESPSAHTVETLPLDFAADIEQILDVFEISSCSVLGHMAGSVYAFAAAGKLHGRFDRIVNVAGGVPIKSLRQFSSMSPRQRAIAWTARFTPRLLPTVLRAGISQIDSGGHDAFMKALYPAAHVDRLTAENPEVAASIQDGYRFSVAQGHRAFEADSRHVTRDWSEYVNPVEVPVTLIHGVNDPVVSIESVRDFANSHENISLLEHDDCGQLILYQKTAEVLDQLTGFNR